MTPHPSVPDGLALRQAHELIASGQTSAAEALLKDALKRMPDAVELLETYGVLLGQGGRLPEAIKHFRRAVKLDPKAHSALYNLGLALAGLGRHAEAADVLARAAAGSDTAHVHERLGDCLRTLGRLEEAAPHYVRAAELEPANALALSSAVETLRRLCDWPRLPALEARLIEAASRGQPVEPLLMLHVTDDAGLQRKAAEAYWRHLVAPTAPRPMPLPPLRPKTRLRIGYLSGDFRQHPMASVISEVIELHDRSSFEVWGLSFGPDDKSAQRRRLADAFERFVDLSGASDAQMIERIRAAGIDILIDLAGYTANARLGVVAARPAPILVHYMGYPGTLGSTAYDYLIADPVVAPADHASTHAEALALLPDTYWAIDRKRSFSPNETRAVHGLPESALVLASFNGQQKLSPSLMDAWARILARVPDAVLWVYADMPAAAGRIKAEASKRGIPADRLVMAGRVPPECHLGRIGLADLMLDAFPYGGHTTTADALWRGVPVLTRRGGAFAARVGASLLTAAGMPELIVDTADDYERLAVELASDRNRLSVLRSRLRPPNQPLPLFDSARFTRALEAAYRQVWRRNQSGNPPVTFTAEPNTPPEYM